MPELPEVETIVRQLAAVLPGHEIQRVEIRRPDVLASSPGTFRKALKGKTVQGVRRRGKKIVISLSRPSFLVVSLGMTGQLIFSGQGEEDEPPPHLAVHLHLHPAGSLYYADVRRFGLLQTLTPSAWEEASMRLGPEPLEKTLKPSAFHRALQTSRSPIRSWLLDQRKLVGVGNIYAAEALFLSGIHPRRPASSLHLSEATALLKALRTVLRRAIRAKGTTLRDYRTASGQEGGFLSALQVYGREGRMCPTCKTPVQRIVFGNRSAFLCPHCQPEFL
jgi:formamidopyrimidine-DNA glycosylase